MQGRVVSAQTGEAVDGVEVVFTSEDHKRHRAELDRHGGLHLRLRPGYYAAVVTIRRTRLRSERVRIRPDGATAIDWSITADDLARVKAEEVCTVDEVIEPAVRGQAAIDCGHLRNSADAGARDTAFVCMTQAADARHAFRFHENLPSYDSIGEGGVYGRVEHGQLVVYRVLYDSDPCGGGCPWKGGSQIDRCGKLELRHDRECRSITACLVCTDPAPTHCLRGGAPDGAPP